ncbi:MAG: alpha/beta fold hydrolase [Anaerolineales bacterium]|jgi:pimeloyl-ACP methyl ester carboxylesterase
MEHKIRSEKHGSVHYWVDGAGEEGLVFTHGATMDHGLFQYQAAFFAERYRMILWDVPGHGRSRPYDQFSLQQAADELVRIMDVEGIQKAHLVGQSMGGYISQIVARDHPHRVISLTAVDSSPMQPSYYSALDTWLLSITPALLRLYPYQTLIKTIANGIASQERSRAYALETLQTYSKSEIAAIMDVVYQGVKSYGYDSALSVPILIVVGEADRTGKVQTYCRQWAQREKRPLQMIAGASHNANMDNPEAFNRVLDTFLRHRVL